MTPQEKLTAERDIVRTFDEVKDEIRRKGLFEPPDVRHLLFQVLDLRRDRELQLVLAEYRRDGRSLDRR